MTHVDIIHSTGPGLLRAALLQLDHAAAVAPSQQLERRLAAPGGPLAAMGVRVLDSATWHPTMPEQKRGRDLSEDTKRVLAASSCNHHFVSSWMAHNISKHKSTAARRQGQPSAVVPVGQSIRTVNPWRSYNKTATEKERRSGREPSHAESSVVLGVGKHTSGQQRRSSRGVRSAVEFMYGAQ